MATSILKDTYRLLRWRLVAVRMAGKVKNALARPVVPPRPTNPFERGRISELDSKGFCEAGPIPADELAQIKAIYDPRAAEVSSRDSGHPFENVVRAEDFRADNPLFRLALSEEVLGAADAYFDGQFLFDSIQVLRSFPTGGPLRESQKWHKDYGDSKSLHFIAYLTDVTKPEDGPFVFIDRKTSRSVAKSPLIRRIEDAQLSKEIGGKPFDAFYGKAGEAILVDPAGCYHYGSRCQTPRTAIFVTFNSSTPYEPMVEPLSGARRQAAAEARKVRPDLPGAYLEAIFGI